MNPLRVLIVTTGLGTGGAEHMLCKLIEAAKSEQINLMVVSLRDEGDFGPRLRALGVPLVCWGLPNLSSVRNFLQVVQKIRAFDPNVLQGWMYHGSLAASIFARILPRRPPVLWGIRQTLYDLKHERFATRVVIRLAATISCSVFKVIYNSRTSQMQHRALGFSDGDDVVIPNGFDFSRYHPDEGCRRQFREVYAIRERQPVIGLVARVHPMKDHQNFILAASRIAAALPEVRFVLAGAGTDSDAIRLKLTAAGILDKTLCLGRLENTESLYPGLDLLVLSSAWGEAWPNVLGEAMACGVPCVATDVGEAADILGGDGVVVPPGDHEMLSNACIRLLTEGVDRHGRASILVASIRRRYGITEVFESYAKLWRVACGESGEW